MCQGSRQRLIPNDTYVDGRQGTTVVSCDHCGGRGVISGYVFQTTK
jgi:hypothetical protein